MYLPLEPLDLPPHGDYIPLTGAIEVTNSSLVEGAPKSMAQTGGTVVADRLVVGQAVAIPEPGSIVLLLGSATFVPRWRSKHR